LTNNLVDDADPAVCPSGREVAFSRGGARYGLYLMRAAGGSARPLTHTSRSADVEPAWSPDGKRLAFVRVRGGRNSVDVLDLRTRRIRQVVASVDQSAAPSWSGDGRWIAYVVDRDGPQIREVRPNGTGGHALVGSGGGNGGAFPAWAPRGRRLAYVRRVQIQVGFYDWSLAVRGPSGGARIIARHVSPSHPAWSPDGRRLVYSSGGGLFSIPAGGGPRRRLQVAPGSSDEPAWSRR
jgi:Tol biopolymer transport system component